MALSQRDRARYARHLLLSQLGEAGQERLLAAAVHPQAGADAGAFAVARSYLQRAGVHVEVHDSLPEHGAASEVFALPSSAEVARISGSSALDEATRALLGALAAVQVIQDVVGLSSSPALPLSFAISSEEA